MVAITLQSYIKRGSGRDSIQTNIGPHYYTKCLYIAMLSTRELNLEITENVVNNVRCLMIPKTALNYRTTYKVSIL
jgi:hypothetical protein